MSDSTTSENARPLHEIADEIFADWKRMREQGEMHPAWPYADAMRGLDTIGGTFGADTAINVVRYFLANAGAWRGETAKRIKAELKGMAGIK